MEKTILLINDMPGYGKVALSAMIPILTHYKINTYNLPTAIVSNTLDYGKFDILDTTEYMKKTLSIWDELGFEFDAIATGFIINDDQAKTIASYCEEKSKTGVKIFCDPIMGDNGSLYNGISRERADYMRRIISKSDLIVPNYTEACLLTGSEYNENGISSDECRVLIDKLINLGAKSVAITSMLVSGENCVVGYDSESCEYFEVPFKYIDVRFPGTGDIFSSICYSKILKGCTLKESIEYSVKIVYDLIVNSLDKKDNFKGIAIENLINLFN